MAIEIYDKAATIKKEGRYFYLLKHGSKNSFTCPNQYITDNDFRRKYLRGMSRDSSWSVIAQGGEKEHAEKAIAMTRWNCSTGGVYGAIRFGNKKNVALWYARNDDKAIAYETLDDEQRANVDSILRWALGDGAQYTIDLANIPEEKAFRTVDTYCGTETPMTDLNSKEYAGIRFWDLDNL